MYQHFRKLTSALLTAALLLTSLGMGSASAAGNETIDSFSKAKKILERQVYFDHRVTLYCGASFDEKKNICPMAFSQKSTRSVPPKSSGSMPYLLKTSAGPSKNGVKAIPSV